MEPELGGSFFCMATRVAIVPGGADVPSVDEISPVSKELVIGLVGHAGTSTAGDRIYVLLEQAGYTVVRIKFSDLIRQIDTRDVPGIEEGARKGSAGPEPVLALSRRLHVYGCDAA